MEFRILGPLEARHGGRVLPLGGSRQRMLLAILLTRANAIVSADRLIDELWGAQPPRTAANALQYHVSQLRKALAPSDPIVTREPGYVLRVASDELDLLRFEHLVETARQAQPEHAATVLREALGLWRGAALADLADKPFAQAEILRLEELRLAALELRLNADLELGRHGELVAELETLVRDHPLREPFRAALMRALYRCGRQAEALDAYRQTRALLVDELGIEPSPALQELERAILRQDPALAAANSSRVVPTQRALMVVADDVDRLDTLLRIAEPLARHPARELLLVRLLQDRDDLATANTLLAARRRELAARGIAARVVAYTAAEPGADVVRLAREHDVDLILADAPRGLGGSLPSELTFVLERAPCDVAVFTGNGAGGTGPIVTPFGGVEHDWSAIEIAAWLAHSLDTSLRLVGTEADLSSGRRDASRLLARASMVVQQVVGIVTEPVLVPPGEEGVLGAATDARLLVVGLSDRWRSEGIGRARLALTAAAPVAVILVRRGLRPSGVAPDGTFTRFTWTLGSRLER